MLFIGIISILTNVVPIIDYDLSLFGKSYYEILQCSPYQAVTGKIYRLKQHFLPPATA